MSKRIIDLTHAIHPEMPAFPGTEPPKIIEANTLEAHGFREKKLSLYSHTGTHMDAPAHILSDGMTLDAFPPENFFGTAALIDVTAEVRNRTGGIIDESLITEREFSQEDLDFLLFYTGWSRYWGTEEYFQGYPVLTESAARLLSESSLKGVGIDTISFDAMESKEFEIHRIFLERNILLIENLTGLEAAELRSGPFLVSLFPLKIGQGDGSPLRAAAIVGI